MFPVANPNDPSTQSNLQVVQPLFLGTQNNQGKVPILIYPRCFQWKTPGESTVPWLQIKLTAYSGPRLPKSTGKCMAALVTWSAFKLESGFPLPPTAISVCGLCYAMPKERLPREARAPHSLLPPENLYCCQPRTRPPLPWQRHSWGKSQRGREFKVAAKGCSMKQVFVQNLKQVFIKDLFSNIHYKNLEERSLIKTFKVFYETARAWSSIPF